VSATSAGCTRAGVYEYSLLVSRPCPSVCGSSRAAGTAAPYGQTGSVFAAPNPTQKRRGGAPMMLPPYPGVRRGRAVSM
jgi:hypothetical protein